MTPWQQTCRSEPKGKRKTLVELNNSTLHHVIIKAMIQRAWAPSMEELCERFGVERHRMSAALAALADYHGVVLHPNSDAIWVVHPFSNAPTSFLVRANDRAWWGNCTWCSLGIVELAGGTATITTALGAVGRQVTVRIENRKVLDKDYVVHFPVKMVNAWDNILYFCSTVLLFEDEAAVDSWCVERGKTKGDVRPLEQVWSFAAEWYGRHGEPDWTKWTLKEAKALFAKHRLTGPIWELPEGGERF